MEADESRRGKDPAALNGGHLCHVCGYQYPNPHPSAKLRRSHRKHCKAPLPPPAAEAGEAVAEVVEEAVAGVAVAMGERKEGGAAARNAAERTPLGGGGGGQREGIGAREANGGGAAVRGFAGGVDRSVEDKVTAEHASPGTGTQTELSENNCLINYSNNESAAAEDTGTQTITSGLSQNGLLNRSSKSIENVNEGNGTESQIACTNGSQTKVERPAEREDSFDDYQDASPFLHQPDSEDGAAPGSVFSTEINNLNTVSSESSVAANEISVETNGLCKAQFPGEPNMRDLSSDSNVGYNLEDGALRLAEPHVKLGSPYEHSVNVDNTYTDMVNSKPDKTGHSEMIGHLNASSLQEAHPLILEPESESTNSRKVEDFMEDGLHVSHTMSEASPIPDTVQLETITNPSTNTMPIGSDLKVVCTDNAPIDCSTELPTQNSTVEDISDDHEPVENSCKKSLECPTASFQYDLPVTNVDDIPTTNVNDLEFTFEERPLPNIIEENPSIEKTNGFTKEDVHNKQIDPEICAEDQLSLTQKHATLLKDQASSVKNPFNLDDDRNDDLFELPTDSCYLEVPNSVELRPQVDSTSLMVDQPTVSNLTRMAEAQQCRNSNECILSTSSAVENGEVIGPEDMPISTSSELVSKTCSTDHSLQEDGHKNGVIFVPSQTTSMEFSTVSMQVISAVSAEVEENMQAKDASAKEMIAVRSIDGMEQATSTTAKNGYAANVEEKKPTEGSAAEMNEVQHSDHADEEKQAGGTELSSVQSMGNLEENKQTDDTDAKEMNARFNGDDVEDKMQKTDGTSAEKMNAGGTDDSEVKMLAQGTTAKEVTAEQSTDTVEEKQQLQQQPNGIVGQEGNSTKQNEEIAAPGARLNSGRVHVPLKVLLAEASAENQVKKPSTKERVLSFRRRVSKDGNSSGSPKSGSDDHHWSSPVKLPRKDVDKSSKGRKQPWMPFICCHSVR
ncbi:hypothetical protein SETIT_2G263200v2 [Setaria italica]|uniref:Uncharacterized protein n=1 Tax=Setaria italica TaxID=4555 RepID=A0A368Q363_SETIT|nr:uncharacterized protein LOC101763182 [Setaria italica]RCV12359.1 hypothetical protein SETIT_2G263200v2 [Setaria italica]